MVRIVKFIQLLILPVDGQSILGKVIGTDAEKIHHELSQKGLELSALKLVKDLPLKSFFFTGPEGYEFEIQEFTSAELKEIFSRD